MGNVSFFWVKDIEGPTSGKVNQKLTWKTTGFWASVHPFQWELDGKKYKDDVKFSKTFDKPGTHTLRVREICPILGSSFHSKWSSTITISITQ